MNGSSASRKDGVVKEIERVELAPGLEVPRVLTGLWQVSGRNELNVEQRVELDVAYVQNRTLAGDLRICLLTLKQLARPGRHGAY